MFRGFLNEIKNVAVNRATNRINTMMNNALGGVPGLPMNRGRVSTAKNSFGSPNPFDGQMVTYPEDLGGTGQGHYIVFNINEQVNANVQFSGKGVHLKTTLKDIEHYDRVTSKLSPLERNVKRPTSGLTSDLADGTSKNQFFPPGQKTNSVPRAATRRLKSTIAMYMPASVGVSTNSNYREVEIGALASGMVSAMNTLSRSNPFDNIAAFSKNVVKAGEDFANAARASEAGETFRENFVRGILDPLPGLSGIGAVQDIQRGFVRNNRLELTFDGIGRRSFSFNFKCMPKSENEAKAVDKIVNMFRFYMAPSFKGTDVSQSRTMIVPATFDITYLFENGTPNAFLNKISTCVLESCDVKYGGERVQFYRPTQNFRGEDGAPPVETDITLGFKEIELITRERIGVGF